MTNRPPRQVACPGCSRPTVYDPANPWRPFCSERCRLIDLGHWANETYRVPAEEDGLEPGNLAAAETDVLSSFRE